MKFGSKNSYNTKSVMDVSGKKYSFHSLKKAAAAMGLTIMQLPNSMKILLENLLRFEDGLNVKKADIDAIKAWIATRTSEQEIAYFPARVLMQDFTGVPAIVDLAAMRDATKTLGSDPKKINPLIPVDLVIDHSVQVDKYATTEAFGENVRLEMQRNKERYEFLKWGQTAFDNFKVVPPGTGICHQVNLEYLARVVWTMEQDGETVAYPDTLVGTDSHTTMINGLAVLGWGVGGIEAEAAMLGQPMSMVIPQVVGFKLIGKLREGTTATDLVLTVTQMLRQKGVVNKFVEFFGPGLAHLPLADRATIANMAPEYGATCGLFPIDDETIKYLELSGRSAEQIALVKAYAHEQGLWRNDTADMVFSDTLELDMSKVEPTLAGPRRPQDKVLLSEAASNFAKELPSLNKNMNNMNKEFQVPGHDYKLKNGDVVIAAITSCTNTSNPYVMIGAGLVARNALKKGLKAKPWVKTSLAPGSKVVTEYLNKAGLQKDLDALGFQLVGYGCTTCIGNSGPLPEEIEKVITDNNLVVGSVLSGNRNFEGRIHPFIRANYLASPMLVVAYALAGSMNINIFSDPLGKDPKGNDIYLNDIWPSNAEIAKAVEENIKSHMFQAKYADVFDGSDEWQTLVVPKGVNYAWNNSSTYIKRPPYFDEMNFDINNTGDISNARILAIFGDSITTDHISPAGNISSTSPAARYLGENSVEKRDFNSYGSRRGNHEVMMRGTFANTRIKNELLPGTEGGLAKYHSSDKQQSIYDVAMMYREEGIPTVVFAGKEYGTGSSRDWAAKGTNLLGVKAIIAESFERIHRSKLVVMGIIPLVFKDVMTRKDLNLTGDEEISIVGISDLKPLKVVKCIISRNGAKIKEIDLICRVDTEVEIEYLKKGGILQYVLSKLA